MDAGGLVNQLSASDSDIFAIAFEELRKNIETVKHSIFEAAKCESDPQTKGALIELLGESKDSAYIPYIAKQLHSKHPEVQFWAFAALQKISTSESLKLSDELDYRKILSELFRR